MAAVWAVALIVSLTSILVAVPDPRVGLGIIGAIVLGIVAWVRLKYPAKLQPTTAQLAKERVVLVTGVADGLGFEVALELAQDDAHCVIATASDELRGQAAVAAIEDAGGCAVFLPMDVLDHQSVAKAAIYIRDHFGHVDVLVHAERVEASNDVLADNREERQKAVATHVQGLIFLNDVLRDFLSHIPGGGHIITIVSADAVLEMLDPLADLQRRVASSVLGRSELEALCTELVDGSIWSSDLTSYCHLLAHAAGRMLAREHTRDATDVAVSVVSLGVAVDPEVGALGVASLARKPGDDVKPGAFVSSTDAPIDARWE